MRFALATLLMLWVSMESAAQLANPDLEPLHLQIEKTMQRHKVPGLQIALTQGDSVLMVRAYGYADLADSSLVDPNSTPFHIGSITKVFTGISLQNAANEGRLNLRADIRDYLDFEIQRPFNDLISLNHLLSHSAGIDELWYDGGNEYVSTEKTKESLERIPIRQIRPSGETFSYSNLSINVAGYILEKQTGKPVFEHYQDLILDPLGMHGTGVLLKKDDPAFSSSYYLFDESYVESPRSRSDLYTSGHIYSTAADMSLFMRALLNGGRVDSTKSLKTDFLSQIGQKRFAYEEHGEYGSGLGIFVTDTQKGKVYSHLGFIHGFTSQMYLFKNEATGIFMSTNLQRGNRALEEIFLFFLKNYLPQYGSEPITGTETPQAARDYIGTYIPTRMSLSGIGKIESLFASRLRFEISGNGSPYLESGGQSIPLVSLGNNLYADTTKFVHKTLSFHQGKDRKILNYSVDSGIYGIWPFMEVKAYERQFVQYPFRIVCLALFLVFPVVWLVRFLKKDPSERASSFRLTLSLAMVFSAVGFLTFAISASNYEYMLMRSMEALPWQINAFAGLNLASAFFTFAAMGLVFFPKKRNLKPWEVILLLLLLLTALNNYIYNSYSLITY